MQQAWHRQNFQQQLCVASAGAAAPPQIITLSRHLRGHFVCLPGRRLMPGIKNKACVQQQGIAAARRANGALRINHILLLWALSRAS